MENVVKYFNLNERSKRAIRKELFDLCLLIALNTADDDEEIEPLIYQEALMLRDSCISEDRFEAAQAITDMIYEYGIEPVDQ